MDIIGTNNSDVINATSTSVGVTGGPATSGNDQIFGNGGNDIISAGGGTDFITGGAGDDIINGQTGTDTAVYTLGSWRDYTITLNGNGTYTVTGTGAAAAEGSDTLSNIENVQFTNGTFSLTDAINDAPVAAAVPTATTNEDTAVTIASSSLVTDADSALGEVLTFAFSNVTGGTVAVNGAGDIVFTPTPNFNGAASFDYQVTDAHGLTSAIRTVPVSVSAVNDAPVNTIPATYTVNEDHALSLTGLSIADEDAAGAFISVTLAVGSGILSASASGSVSVTGSGTGSLVLSGAVTYINAYLLASPPNFIPASNESGSVTLTVTTNDGGNTGAGGALSDIDTSTISVAAESDAPTVAVSPASGNEDSAIPLTISPALTDPSETLSITITGVPAGAGFYNGPVPVGTNDGGGSWTLTPGEMAGLTITPPLNYDQNFTLSVTATSVDGSAAPASTGAYSLLVTVTPVNDTPVITAQVHSLTLVDTAAADTYGAIGGNLVSNDVDGPIPTYALTSPATSGLGTLTVNADGTYSYVPNAAAINALPAGPVTDVFNVTVSDGIAGPVSTTLTFNITGANDTPVITAQVAATTLTDTAAADTFANVTGTLTSSDVDAGATATYALTSPATSGLGTLTVNADGTYSYVPNAAAINALPAGPVTDVFNVTVSDGIAGPVSTTLTFNITGANDTPVITAQVAATTLADTAVADTFANVTGTLTSSDVDAGATATYALGLGENATGSYGSLTVNADGTYTYVPDAAAINALPAGPVTDVFHVTVSDIAGPVSTTLTFNITGANDTPVITAQVAATTLADTAVADTFANVTGTLTSSDVDAGATATYALAVGQNATGSYGSLTVNADGTYTYVPNAAAINALPAGPVTDVFNVTVSDGIAGPVSTTLTFNITGANDTPVITAQVAATTLTDTAAADTFANVTGTLTSSDVDAGATATYALTSPATSGLGTLTVNADGTYSYVPNAAAINALPAGPVTDVFNVTVSDGIAGPVSTTLTFNITGANDGPVARDDSATLAESVADASASLVLSGNVITGLVGASVVAGGTDTDVDTGDTLTVSVVDGLAGNVGAGIALDFGAGLGTLGNLTVNANGSWTFVPTAAGNGLAQGDVLTADIPYTMRDAAGLTSAAILHLTLQGSNDTSTIAVSTAQVGALAEDALATATGTLTVTDPDTGEDFFIVANGSLASPALAGTYGSLTINAAGAWIYTLNNANPTVNALASGETLTDTITVRSFDGTTFPLVVNIVGSNDAPTVTAQTASATEGGSSVSVNALAGASDVDNGHVLSVVNVPGVLPAGVTYNAGTSTFTLDPTNAAYDNLAANATTNVVITYGVFDGTATTPNTVTFTITGTNDAPVVTAQTGSATEGGATVTVNALAGASDVDTGATLSVVDVPTTLPDGVSYAAGSFTLDPTHAIFDDLAAGETRNVAVTYGVSDGTTTTPNTVTFTITGTNDAPTITAESAPTVIDTAATDTFAPAISGQLDAADVDTASSAFTYGIQGVTASGGFATQTNGFGTLSVNTTTGAYTFAPNVNAINGLANGATPNTTFTVTVSDGIAPAVTQTLTVNFAGANDTPVITAELATPTLVDTTVADTLAPVTGQLDATDAETASSSLIYGIDGVTASAGFATQTSALGTLSVNVTTGEYIFTPNAAAIDALAAGSHTAAFNVSISDGNTGSTSTLTVNITGANDAPTLTLSTPTASITDTAAANTFAPITGTAAGVDAEGESLNYSISGGTSAAGVSTLVSTYGTLTIDEGSGAYTFTPNATVINALNSGNNPSPTFAIFVSDGTSISAANLTINITGANDAPTLTLSAPSATINDTTAAIADVFPPITGTAAGADAEGLTVTYGITGGTSNAGVSTFVGTYGTLTINETSGAYTFTPNSAAINALNSGEFPDDTFPITASDGTSTTSTDLTISIVGANDAATVVGQLSGLVTEDAVPASGQSVSGTLTVADIDDVSNTFIGETVAGTYGSLTITAGGAWTYTLANANAAVQAIPVGQTLTDTITVRTSGETPATVSITIAGTNDAPVFVGVVTSSLNEGAGVQTVNLLAGASDVDSDQVLSLVSGSVSALPAGFTVSGSTLRIDTNHSAYNSLAAGQQQIVVLTYQVEDNHGLTAFQSASITITGTNDAPVVTAQTGSATEGGASVTVNALAGASDVDVGNTLSVVDVPTTLPDGVSYAAGSFTLDPTHASFDDLAAGATRTVAVTYGVSDGTTMTPNTVTFTITGTNDAPVVTAQTGSATEGGASVTVNALAGASDVDVGNTLSVVDVPTTLPDGVSYAAGSFTLDPTHASFDDLAAGATRTVAVTYGVSDGTTMTPNTVTFTITGTNDAPVVTAQTGSATEGGASVTVNALAGASDVDVGNTLSVVDVPTTLPDGVSYAAGSFTLDPTHASFDDLAAGATRTVAVTYGVSDGTTMTPNTVTFTITGTNDAPVVTAQTGSATEGGASVTVNALAGASDVDVGNTLSVVDVPTTLPDGVSYAAGSFTLDPTHASFDDLAAGATRTVAVTYGVSDGTTMTPNTVTFTITGTNDAPVVTAQTGSATEGGASVTVNALAGASDVDVGNTLSVVDVPTTLPDGVSYAAGSFTLDPTHASFDDLAAGATRTVAVTYGVSDGTTMTPNTVTFTITGTNDAPVVTAQTGSATEGGASVTVNALAGASDVDVGNTLSVVDVPTTLPDGVSYAAGSFTLDPTHASFDDLAAGATRTVAVTYGVSDGTTMTPNTVTFTITGTNDAPVVTAQTGSATEGGASVTVNALAGASDVDVGNTLSVVDVPTTLPDGVSYAAGSFTLDPTHASFDDLAAGATRTVAVTYGVSDGTTMTPNTVTFTITGTNDAPTAIVATGNSISENSANGAVVSNLTAADMDGGTPIFTLLSDPTGAFGISGSNIVVTNSSALNFETLGGSAILNIRVSDGAGGSFDQAVTVSIQNVVGNLTGTSGDDYLIGTGEEGVLSGLGGNDILQTSGSTNTLLGGSGFDHAIFVGSSAVNMTFTDANELEVIVGGDGANTLNAAAVTTSLILYGGVQGDTLTQGSGGGYLFGGSGNDTLIGGAGIDQLFGGAGADTLNGGAGTDYLYVDGQDTILGGEGFDYAFIDTAEGANISIGLSGVEYVIGNSGNDGINGAGSTESLIIDGGEGNDTLTQGSGGGYLFGGSGNDTLIGGAGIDQLFGGAGADTLVGGAGTDYLYVDGLDTIQGGEGFDFAFIDTSEGANISIGLASIEYAIGNSGNDGIDGAGSTVSLIIDGGGGNDTLTLGSGGGYLFGGAGQDRLVSGAGNDGLFGGENADVFAFNQAWGSDVVYDFQAGIDRIDLSSIAGINGITDISVASSGVGSGDYTIITYLNNTILVLNAPTGTLNAADFIF